MLERSRLSVEGGMAILFKELFKGIFDFKEQTAVDAEDGGAEAVVSESEEKVKVAGRKSGGKKGGRRRKKKKK